MQVARMTETHLVLINEDHLDLVGKKKPRAIKCKFYKSIGHESSVERREFEIWNGSISEDIGPILSDIILSHERPDFKNL